MAKANQHSSERWLGAMASGLSLNFVQGIHPWWPVAWVALIPLLIAVYVAPSFRDALRLAIVASLLGLLGDFTRGIGNIPVLEFVVGALVFLPPFAVPLVAMLVVWRIVIRTMRQWYAPLVFPAIAAAVEFGFTSLHWHGTWGSWANSQMNALPVIQTAALGGTPAVVFLITLPASTAAIVIVRGRRIAAPAVAYSVPALLVAAAIGYGFVRLANIREMARIPIGLVASDRAEIMPSDPGGPTDATLAAYLAAATTLTDADIVILPEKLEIVEEEPANRLRERLASWSREHRTHLLAGLGIVAPEYRDNKAWLFDRSGERIVDYAKQHLVPLLEWRFRSGEQDAVVTIEGHTFGVAICKDMGFPRLSRRYGRAGIEAMLVPAWDFGADGVYHSRMAVLRGVEQGFSVIRTANQGMLTVSDAYGRIVAETASANGPVATLAAVAPLGGFGTIYGAIGDTFAWVCITLVALLTLRAVRVSKRESRARPFWRDDAVSGASAAVD